MSRIRGLAVVVVLALLAASAAQALPAPRPAAPETIGFFAPLWSWLAGWLAPADGGAQLAVAAKSVAVELPEPAPLMSPPSPVPTKDPTGGGLPNPGDAGGEMDPNG